MYPDTRMRRNRRTEALRNLSAETVLTRNDLIMPFFVVDGEKRNEPIDSMPGVSRMSVDGVIESLAGTLVSAVLLFGVPEEKDKNDECTAAMAADGIIPDALRKLKAAYPQLVLITDVCVCGYTSHGHCGVLDAGGEVVNDASLELLAEMAGVHAQAGADVVAPSAMMDGQIAAIRSRLDELGFCDTAIMSYSTKYKSSYYGPFRDAAHSAPGSGDRSSYQMAVGNRKEGVREALLDEEEGADWVMVKPGLPYLDVIRDISCATRLPVAAYQVSGEYAMLKFAAQAGAIDEKGAVLESLMCFKRAGADAIITYYAHEVAAWLAG